MIETYEHSGRSGAVGVPVAATIGTIAAFLGGGLYAYIINWIPFVYLNLLATIGLGLAVGAATGIGANLGKIRNNMVVTLLGITTGVLALYVAWAIDPFARTNHEIGPFFAVGPLLKYISDFYTNGFWGMGRGGGVMVSGIFLGVIWFIEAVVIVGGSTLVALGTGCDHPFCEECNCWTEQTEGLRSFHPPEDLDMLDAACEQGDLTALDALTLATGKEDVVVRLDIASCENCTESNYLTVQVVTTTIDKDGDESTSEMPLVTNMVVTAEDIEFVRGAGQKAVPPKSPPVKRRKPKPVEELDEVEELDDFEEV